MEIRGAHFNPATHSLSGTESGGKQPPEVRIAVPADQSSPAMYAKGVTAKMTAKGTQGKADTADTAKFFGGDPSKFSGFISSVKDAQY